MLKKNDKINPDIDYLSPIEIAEKPPSKEELMEFGMKPNVFLESMRIKSQTQTFREHFLTKDGFHIFFRYWLPSEILKNSKKTLEIRKNIQLDGRNIPSFPEKIIICIHGLHSHGQKFVLLADYFSNFPWLVISPDLRGHGLSWDKDYIRGDVENYNIWIQDCIEFIKFIEKIFINIPIHIVAESMGAALAVLLMDKLEKKKIQSLVLLSPALKPFKFAQMGMIEKALTNAIKNGINNPVIHNSAGGRFTTNSDAYKKYQANDPLRLEYVTPRYYFQVLKMIHQLKLLNYDQFTPSCLFFGDKDYLIDMLGLKEYIKRLGTTQKCLYYIPDAYHELLTDENAQKYDIFKKIVLWINNI